MTEIEIDHEAEMKLWRLCMRLSDKFDRWERNNVTRQANPVEAAGPVAGETETTSETTISVEG